MNAHLPVNKDVNDLKRHDSEHMISQNRRVSVEIRRQIASLARKPRRRTAAFSRARPTRWEPFTVINPETDFPFSRESAWELVAREIERQSRVDVVKLRHPAGATGYVMKIRLEPNRPRLYIKLELRPGRIYGRSFHYSDH